MKSQLVAINSFLRNLDVNLALMPLSHFKRRARRFARRMKSWLTIVELTLSGNSVERVSNLKNSNRPVMLLYGFGATRRTLSILEKRLQQDGYPTFSVNLGGLFNTFNTSAIEELGKYIEKKVERLYRKYHFRGRLAIIAHSKGGLIAQYYVKKLSGAKRVKKLITLGTPHNGSVWAFLMGLTPAALVMKSIRQMAPRSKLIKSLRETPFPHQVKVYSIYSKSDTVSPFPAAVLTEAPHVKNIEVPGVTHSELLIKKNVYYAIRHALKDEMPLSWEAAGQRDYEDHLRNHV